jgi:PAS domain S-box-containing protein
MKPKPKTKGELLLQVKDLENQVKDLESQVKDLENRLEEAEETFRAIRGGEVDALVVETKEGDQVFTLKDADRAYRLILETLNEGVLTVMPEGGIMYSNSRFAEMLKMPLHKVIGTSIFGYMPPTERAAFDAVFAQGVRENRRAEISLITGDGTLLPVQLSVNPWEAEGVPAVCIVAVDLTERKQAENALQMAHDTLEVQVRDRTFALEQTNEELRTEVEARQKIEQDLVASERRLATFAAATFEGIVDSERGRILDCNEQYARMLGYTVNEMKGMAIADLIAPEDRDGVMDNIRRGGESNTEHAMLRKDGARILVEVEGKPTTADRRIAVLRDITARKQMEKALRESEERYRRLFQGIQEYFVLQEVIEDDGKPVDLRYLEINPAMERLLGKTRAEVVGRTRSEVLGQPDPELVESVGRVAGTGEPLHTERYSRAVGRWFESFSYRSRAGEVATLAVDTTDRKRAEEALRKAHAELEIRVQERTAELEERNKELQEFIFIASHDLQEPLRKIRTFGDLMLNRVADSLSDEGRDYVSRMQKASARMQALLQSLLAYSRITTKEEPFKETSLRQSIEEALSTLEMTVKEKDARVEVADLPNVEANGTQMIHLFQNLISNALKFQEGDQPPHVRIDARALEDKSGKTKAYEIRVDDNGIGFDESYLDKIFIPFQRLHGKDQYEGVGMGLAICKKIVERHGGSLTARSTLGKGATFIVTLPAKQRAERR